MWQHLGTWYHQLKEYYQNSYPSAASLQSYQSKKLNKILAYSSYHIRFYHSYKNAYLPEYPIIDKSFVQEHFAVLNRNALSYQQAKALCHDNQGVIQIHQSLGTTGAPGYYLYSTREKIASLGHLLSKMHPKLFGQPKKIAVFHLSLTPYLTARFSTQKMQWLLLDLNQSFSGLVNQLQRFDPEVLVASVQTLCELAKLQLTGKISLRCHKIIATAEVLTPLAQQLIKMAFKQDVHQLYQCAEGCLGITCEYGTLHLNEDEFFIEKEWVDHKKQRFIPVITTLKRTLQPLIRYRMEDILALKSSACRCGNPALAVQHIVGRCEDVLYFKEKYHNGLKPIYADAINHALSQSFQTVQRYQILQYSMRHLLIKIGTDNFALAKQQLSTLLDRLWETEAVQTPEVEFMQLDSVSLNEMFRATKRQEKSAIILQPILDAL